MAMVETAGMGPQPWPGEEAEGQLHTHHGTVMGSRLGPHNQPLLLLWGF